MAKIFEGKAPKVAQVVTYTVEASPTNGEIFSIGFDHPSGSLGSAGAVIIATDTASSDTGTSIATELAAQINASRHPFVYGYTGQRGGVTATSNGADVIITAKYPGVPFISAVGSTTTGTLTKADTTANSGPNDISVAGNYLGGVALVDADTAIFTGMSDLLYGFQIMTALELVSVTFNMTCKQIGWAEAPLPIDCGASSGTLHYQCPLATAYIQLEDTTVGLFRCINAGRGLYLTGDATSPNTTLIINDAGNLYLAWHTGSVFSATSIQANGGNVKGGPGLTFTNWRTANAACYSNHIAASTLIRLTGDGSFILDSPPGNAQGQVLVDAGSLDWRRGTITALNIYGGEATDLNAAPVATDRVATNTTIHAEADTWFSNNTTFTNAASVLGIRRSRGGGKAGWEN